MNFLQRLALQGKETWWQLASRCCWNRARPWHASELVSFLVGLRTYQHLGIWNRPIAPNYDWLVRRTTYVRRNTEASLCEATLKSVILYHSNRGLSWLCNVAGNNKTYLGLHIFCRQVSNKDPTTKFHEKPSSGSRAVCGQRGGGTWRRLTGGFATTQARVQLISIFERTIILVRKWRPLFHFTLRVCYF